MRENGLLNVILSKLKLIGLGLIGILGIAVSVMYGLLQREKAKSIQSDLDDERETSELSDRAAEATIRGLNEESKPIIRNGRNIG